jgi:hypothetical protein
MDFAWLHALDAALLSLILAVAMTAAALVAGRRAQARAAKKAGSAGAPAIEAALLGLLGLLLAFTFSGAASRFDTRSHQMVEVASAIRAAAERADFYPPEMRTALRRGLADYVEAQGVYYRSEHDETELRAATDRIKAIQQRLWSHVVGGSRDPANALATAQMSGKLDVLFALSESREVSSRNHMPGIVVVLLFVIATATAYASGHASGLAGGFRLANYGMFSILTSLVVYVTLDLDRPGRGIIRRDVQEQAIEAVGARLQD